MGSLHCTELARDPIFQRRVDYYLKKAAIAIIGEDDQIVGHNKRVTYSKNILDGRVRTYDWALAVLTNGTLATTVGTEMDPDVSGPAISDGDLEFTVNSMINDFAGVD